MIVGVIGGDGAGHGLIVVGLEPGDDLVQGPFIELSDDRWAFLRFKDSVGLTVMQVKDQDDMTNQIKQMFAGAVDKATELEWVIGEPGDIMPEP